MAPDSNWLQSLQVRRLAAGGGPLRSVAVSQGMGVPPMGARQSSTPGIRKDSDFQVQQRREYGHQVAGIGFWTLIPLCYSLGMCNRTVGYPTNCSNSSSTDWSYVLFLFVSQHLARWWVWISKAYYGLAVTRNARPAILGFGDCSQGLVVAVLKLCCGILFSILSLVREPFGFSLDSWWLLSRG